MIIGLTALAQALDSKQAHTSFGKLPLSVEETAAAYNFPKAKRDDISKIYMGELSKKLNSGVGSPGPAYMFEDNIKYDMASISKEVDFDKLSRMISTAVTDIKKEFRD